MENLTRGVPKFGKKEAAELFKSKQDLTKGSPKLGKKEKYLQVFNPNANPVVANELGQALSGYTHGLVHPEDSVAKRAIEKGLLQVTSS